MDGAARVDEIETAGERQARHVAVKPADRDPAFPREPLRLAEPRQGDVHADNLKTPGREKNAVAPFAASEVQHARSRRQERA